MANFLLLHLGRPERVLAEFARVLAPGGLLGGTVRLSAIVAAQPEETQQRIRATFDRIVAPYENAGRLELPVSVKLGSGRKP